MHPGSVPGPGGATVSSTVAAVEVLLVYANPEPASFGAAVRDAAVEGCRRAGHRVTVVDLYDDGFDPCLTAGEHRRYLEVAADHPDPLVRRYLDLVRRADALVLVYPTWWSGLPAVAKGWLERVLLPGVAFELHPRTHRVRPGLTHLRHVVGVTTLGGPRWESIVLGNAGRRTITRGLRVLTGRRCRIRWLALYRLDDSTPAEREAFLARVRDLTAGLPA
jgi:putative NADPH-quinone reductase